LVTLYDINLEKLRKFCAYQDRCHQEVRKKAKTIEVYGDDLENMIIDLINEDFLNEERFAQSYARGKFKMKKWGRMKIKQELKRRQVSDYCIKKGFQEIDEEEYEKVCREILEKKMAQLNSKSALLNQDKAIKYAYSRGYESALIYKIIKDLELGY